MMIRKKIAALIFPLLCFTSLQAQVFDDGELRQFVGIEYVFNKKLSVSGTYFLQNNDNMIRFKRSLVEAGVSYKITSWMKAGFEYRYGTSYTKDFSRLRYSLTFDYAFSKKWKVKYRPMLQQEFTYLNSDYMAAYPLKYTLRNRITLNYTYNKKTDFYIFTENYTRCRNTGMLFFRQKSAVGIDRMYKKRNKFNLQFDVINKWKGENITRLNLGYTYTFGYVKKNKKKNETTTTPVETSSTP